jgi:hypothetical protein
MLYWSCAPPRTVLFKGIKITASAATYYFVPPAVIIVLTAAEIAPH